MKSITDIFIDRPVATTLATVAITLAGALAYVNLPVAPLPQVDFPTISVSANLPGASPETMAATVASPLERVLGRIPGLTEMTSSSSSGSTRINLQFDLSKNADACARQVSAAINAARSLLPAGLPGRPTYRKMNPADSPIAIISLTSPIHTPGQMYDAAATLIGQKISQVDGVGTVNISGSSLPAVRVRTDLSALTRAGLATSDVREAVAAANVDIPKGYVEDGHRSWQVTSSGTLDRAAEYEQVIVRQRPDSVIRVGDVAQVTDGIQDAFTYGTFNGQRSVQLVVFRQAGANIIKVVDEIRGMLPGLRDVLPASMSLHMPYDRTGTIRSSVSEVQHALLISIALVVLVVFAFLRSPRATLIPGIAVPVSLIGAVAVMYLCDHSLNNLTLMALTIATGFVVDDAVVVLENISRHIEGGLSLRDAARRGAREVTFTVVSMSLSLVAVFIPILFMGGLLGRLFREFAVVLTAAILLSLVISLTLTPMMCGRLLRARQEARGPGAIARLFEGAFQVVQGIYADSLAVALRWRWVTLAVFLAVTGLTIHLYVHMPRSYFPLQDNGMLFGGVSADQNISFRGMREKLIQISDIIRQDPAVQSVNVSTGGGSHMGGPKNSSFMFVALKPIGERDSMMAVQARFRAALSRIPGASVFLQASQDVRIGARSSQALYQYTLQSGSLELLRDWEPRVRAALTALPQLVDVNSDFQDRGNVSRLIVDRKALVRLGVSMRSVDEALNSSFGQRIVSTIYAPLNQYRVILEAAQSEDESAFEHLRVRSDSGELVPMTSLARWEMAPAPLSVNHQGLFAALTFSFNLAPGVAFTDATTAMKDALSQLGLPEEIRGQFAGSAGTFQASLSSQPLLILTAVLVIYLVLGILYESFLHPLTILSTLPPAGAGAMLALAAAGFDFSLMALIGVFLLIGIVKKNAIMMIDFALVAEREGGCTPAQAIHQACLLRLRPILMTTLAALFGAMPLIIGTGAGAELRRPVGISIAGGLIVSQALTLYTTPVIYLLLESLRQRLLRWRRIPDFHPHVAPS